MILDGTRLAAVLTAPAPAAQYGRNTTGAAIFKSSRDEDASYRRQVSACRSPYTGTLGGIGRVRSLDYDTVVVVAAKGIYVVCSRYVRHPAGIASES